MTKSVLESPEKKKQGNQHIAKKKILPLNTSEFSQKQKYTHRNRERQRKRDVHTMINQKGRTEEECRNPNFAIGGQLDREKASKWSDIYVRKKYLSNIYIYVQISIYLSIFSPFALANFSLFFRSTILLVGYCLVSREEERKRERKKSKNCCFVFMYLFIFSLVSNSWVICSVRYVFFGCVSYCLKSN